MLKGNAGPLTLKQPRREDIIIIYNANAVKYHSFVSSTLVLITLVSFCG